MGSKRGKLTQFHTGNTLLNLVKIPRDVRDGMCPKLLERHGSWMPDNSTADEKLQYTVQQL